MSSAAVLSGPLGLRNPALTPKVWMKMYARVKRLALAPMMSCTCILKE